MSQEKLVEFKVGMFVLSALTALAAFIFSVTLLPAVTTLLPVKVTKGENSTRIMNMLAEFVIQYWYSSEQPPIAWWA